MAVCSENVNEFSVPIKGLEFLYKENYFVTITNSFPWFILF